MYKLGAPVPFAYRVGRGYLLLNPLWAPVIAEPLPFNVLFASNVECVPLFVVWVTVSMRQSSGFSNLFAYGVRGVLLCQSFEARFLRYGANLQRSARLVNQPPKLPFRSVARPLIRVTCADQRDGSMM